MHLTGGREREGGKKIYNLGYSGEFITPVRRCSIASGGGRKREEGKAGPGIDSHFLAVGLPAGRAGVDEPGRRKIIIVPVAFACG